MAVLSAYLWRIKSSGPTYSTSTMTKDPPLSAPHGRVGFIGWITNTEDRCKYYFWALVLSRKKLGRVFLFLSKTFPSRLSNTVCNIHLFHKIAKRLIVETLLTELNYSLLLCAILCNTLEMADVVVHDLSLFNPTDHNMVKGSWSIQSRLTGDNTSLRVLDPGITTPVS